MRGNRQEQWGPEGCGSEVPTAMLRFDNSREKLTELSWTAILRVTVYYSKRIQTTISDRERRTGRAQESSRCGLSDVLSPWSHLDSAYLPWQPRVATHTTYCQPGEVG